MQIKQNLLLAQLKKNITPIYFLIGQEHFLINESYLAIKNQLKTLYPYEEKLVIIQSNEDWRTLNTEADSYSLFSEKTLIQAIYDKKTLDALGKKTIKNYIEAINPHCTIVIKAPNLTTKQLAWLAQENSVIIVTHYPFNSELMLSWINTQLRKNNIRHEPQVPYLIEQYTQGNMLACAQAIEKLTLYCGNNQTITEKEMIEQLSNQCEYSLFDLIDSCLAGQATKAIEVLRQVENTKIEPVLVLWTLTQEIRTLIQLIYLSTQSVDMKTAASQLKIWPQKINLYLLTGNRIKMPLLQKMLVYCQNLDEQIKSNTKESIWHALERLCVNMCLGQSAGHLCLI